MRAMKRIIPAAAIVLASFGATQAHAQALAVDGTGSKRITLSDKVGKNQFTWTSDAPLERIRGTAEGVAGSLTVDPKNLSTIKGTISAQVTTMKTGNTTRDGHLRSAGWLDADNYPAISFTVTSVRDLKVDGATATGTAVGNFSMHGVTKSISVPFTLKYLDESARTRERAPGDLVMIDAEFTISLKDFGVTGAKGMVGSKVGEQISIKAQLFGSSGL